MDKVGIDFTRMSELVFAKVDGWVESAVQMLPNMIIAIIFIIGFVILAKVAGNTADKILGRISDNEPAQRFLVNFVHFIIVVLGIFVALEILNLDKAVTSLLTGAGLIGLAIGFAFQEIASNFIAGILIAFRKPFAPGDIVEVKEYRGVIDRINLRTTIITTFQGLEVIIPNKDMFTHPVVNFTSTPRRRIDLDVGISYGENLRHVEKVVREAVEDINGRIKERPVEFFYKEFGDSSINFELRIWVRYPDQQYYFQARHDAVILIKEAFNREGITIPFPIRTLDFGIKGGQKLEQSLGHHRDSQPEA
jgi:small conductance mechanosensitive channel